jgi:hypothetical protein
VIAIGAGIRLILSAVFSRFMTSVLFGVSRWTSRPSRRDVRAGADGRGVDCRAGVARDEDRSAVAEDEMKARHKAKAALDCWLLFAFCLLPSAFRLLPCS